MNEQQRTPTANGHSSRQRLWAGVVGALVVAFVMLLLFTGRAGDPDKDAVSGPTVAATPPPDATPGTPVETVTPTAEPTPTSTPIPWIRPTAENGIEFTAYPHVNDNGTYFSTLGAPHEYTPWIYSQDLLWNQPLPDDTPALANSATIAGHILETVQGRRFVDYSSAIESAENAPYVLLVDSAREDFVEIESDCFGSPHNGWGWEAEPFESYINNVYPGRKGVPMPSSFEVDGDDSDFAVTIYDYREDILFDFWVFKASNLTGGLPSACWGGVIRGYARGGSDGIFPYPVGGSASGLTAAGTTITLEDLRQGSIDHVLSVSTLQIFNEIHLDNTVPSASYPANRNDGLCASSPKPGWDLTRYSQIMGGVGDTSNCLREGQRLRLPAGTDISGIEHPVARMVAEAMRDYGIVVHDYGGCFCLQGESGRIVEMNGFGFDPWIDAYDSTPDWQVMQEIPWDLLEVLPPDWGKPPGYERPCISTYTWLDSDPACERAVAPYQPG